MLIVGILSDLNSCAGEPMTFRKVSIIPDLIEFFPDRITDDRGYFSELFRLDSFFSAVGSYQFTQENESMSLKAGTIRGLHYQSGPAAQGKLVRCTAGAVFDVAVDIRAGSPTYGCWGGVELSPAIGNWLWIPPGFAHGFCTLFPNSVLNYKVTAYYSAEYDKGLAWDDPDIRIEWPAIADPETLSVKDRAHPKFSDLPPLFLAGDHW